MNRSLSCSFLLITLCATRCGAVPAPPLLTFIYEGVVEFATGGPPFDAFLGEVMRFEYTFDPATPDAEPSPDDVNGRYPDAIVALNVSLGDNAYTLKSGERGTIALVSNPGGLSIYNAGAFVMGPAVGGVDVESINLFLLDNTFDAFGDDALPTTPPDPTPFGIVQLALTFSDGDQDSRLLSTMPRVIPEPASLALLGTGGLSLSFFGRRNVAKGD